MKTLILILLVPLFVSCASKKPRNSGTCFIEEYKRNYIANSLEYKCHGDPVTYVELDTLY